MTLVCSIISDLAHQENTNVILYVPDFRLKTKSGSPLSLYLTGCLTTKMYCNDVEYLNKPTDNLTDIREDSTPKNCSKSSA